jgi:1,2-diacylglycerol 3-alpha-glucosyltransferase
MRVLIISQAPSQWQNPLFRFLARERGIDLEVVFGEHEVPIDPELGHAPLWGATATCDGFRSSVAPTDWTGVARCALRTAKRRDLDVVVVPGWGTKLARLFLSATMASAEARRRTVIFTDATDLTERTGSRATMRAFVLNGLGRAGLHFGVTGTAARTHLQRSGVDDSKIIVLPYVVDNDFIAAETMRWRWDRDSLRAKLAGVLDPEAHVLLAVAKLIPREGAHRLVQAFLDNATAHPSARLILVGDGPDRSAIEHLCRQPGGDRVVLLGYQPYSELPRLYAMADWFVHLPEREPWGLSVNEAVAAGLPLLCSRKVGAAQDLLEDGVNGILVGDTETEAALALHRALDTSRTQLEHMRLASARFGERVHYRQWAAGLRTLADGRN